MSAKQLLDAIKGHESRFPWHYRWFVLPFVKWCARKGIIS